jgi:hypothetical protein
MKCEEMEGKIIDYLDGKLDKGDNIEIEKHLETCERCLDEFRDLQEVMKLIAGKKEADPDESLRINFYHMLHNEIRKNKLTDTPGVQRESLPWYNQLVFRIAAGFALLICGTLIGLLVFTGINSSQQAQMEQLRGEVTALKKSAIFTLLRDESSSERIQALNYTDEIETPDDNLIEVLLKTLNTDKNINVRMAAAYALAKYSDNQAVCESLVESLSLQNDPILQVTLINILVEKKVRNAVQPIQKIIADENTLDEVKNIAQNGIKMLI